MNGPNRIHVIKLDIYNDISKSFKELENNNNSSFISLLDKIILILEKNNDELILENLKVLEKILKDEPDKDLKYINKQYKKMTQDDLEFLITDIIYWLASDMSNVMKELILPYEFDELLDEIILEEEIITNDYIENCWGDELYLLKPEQMKRLKNKLPSLKIEHELQDIDIKKELSQAIDEALATKSIGLVYVVDE